MRVFEVSEIFSFRRVGGSDLARFDLKLRLTESAAAEEFLIWRKNVSRCVRHECNPCHLVGYLHGGHLSGRTKGFCFFGSPERMVMATATIMFRNSPDEMVLSAL